MATTYNYSTNDYYGIGSSYVGTNKEYVIKRVVDLADAVTTFLTPAGGTAFGANDVLKLIRVPAKTWVKAVVATVTAADTTLTDSDIGDGDNVDGYIDGLSFATADVVAACMLMTDTAPSTAYSVPVGGGKYYTAADTIDWKLITAGAVNGVLTLTVVCEDMSL